jgi:hypothetical protein
MLADLGPHRQEHALPLVVAGAASVGLPEITHHDRAVDSGNDLAQGELLRRSGQYVTSTDAPLGTHEASSLEREQYLLEIGLREPCAKRDVTD